MQPNKKIVLVGGGTAGHVLPLLAVAEELRSRQGRIKFYYFGSGQISEKKEAAGKRIKYIKILSGKWRRNLGPIVLLRNIFDLVKTFLGLVQSIYLLSRIKPDAVFSKGGFVAVPVSLASGLLGIPLIIHESDLQLGFANKISLKFATRIATAFPLSMYAETVRKKGFYSGVPLRREFIESRYKITDDHILITGGSSGAIKLNEIFYAIGQDILKKHKVVHIVGREGLEKAETYKKSLPSELKKKYTLFGYTQDMAKLISSAKLVISRAGSSSIFEIASLSKKAILIPIGEDIAPHQMDNARVLAQAKLASVFKQDDNPQGLLRVIESALASEHSLTPLAFPYSSRLIADSIVEVIERNEFLTYNKIFLIGMGGVSMRGLKYLFERLGKSVTGSDVKTGGHSAQNITKDIDLVVYSSAITKKSPGFVELEAAKSKRIPTMKRSEVIGELMKGKNGISVAGMHGKTTISMLLSRTFEIDGQKPTYLVGAPNSRSAKAFELGSGKDFIAEACEYDDSFLDFDTSVAVISNIEEEHLDYFKGGISEIKNHFVEFCQLIKPGGALIYCGDDKNVIDVVKKVRKTLYEKNIKIYSYGFTKGADFNIEKYKVDRIISSFAVKAMGKILPVVSSIPGKHFALNATACIAVSFYCGIDLDSCLAAIANFEGAKRRMELVARRNGVAFFDDYGHHPTEITATLDAFDQMYPKSRKILLFEPHQQKRFNDLYGGFVDSFKKTKFDFVGILPVYRVEGRDVNSGKSSRDLVNELKKSGRKYYFIQDYDKGVKFLNDNLKKGDIVVTMGATDVYKIIEKYLEGIEYE